VADGYHLWSQRYDRKLDDVFAIQDEISLSIVQKLKAELLGEQPQALVQRATENMEAYNLYLKGLHYRSKWSPKIAPKAVDCLKKAIELDPGFAKAHASLAEVYIDMTHIGALSLLSRKEAYPLIKDAVEKALALDNTLSEAYTVLGMLRGEFEWDWQAADQAYERALELNPHNVYTIIWSAFHRWITGRYDEAVSIAHQAEARDPLSLIVQHAIGGAYFFARRFDEAIERFERIIELEPNYFLSYIFKGASRLRRVFRGFCNGGLFWQS